MSHRRALDDPAVRVEAVEALLVEKGLVDPSVIDEVIEHYETNVGPLNGAKVVARHSTAGGRSMRSASLYSIVISGIRYYRSCYGSS